MLSRGILSRLSGNSLRGASCRQITNESVTRKRNELFSEEAQRQRSFIKRIEKIEVHYKGVPENCTLIMNKGISTPYNCAMHMKEFLMVRSAVALVNGKPWDMHRPFEEDCELELLHFRLEDPSICNMAYWRTCSFVLGYILERAFKPEHYIELCSFPKPDLQSGSFVYDVDLHIDNWKPDSVEFNCLSREGGKLMYKDFKFERLEVNADLALKMFEDNRFKREQIPSIANKSYTGTTVPLYRMNDHVDITNGPLISFTNQIGRFSITAAHDIESPSYGKLTRFQGVSVPSHLSLHFYAFEKLRKRSEIPNPIAPLPIKSQPQKEAVGTSV